MFSFHNKSVKLNFSISQQGDRLDDFVVALRIYYSILQVQFRTLYISGRYTTPSCSIDQVSMPNCKASSVLQQL